MGQVSGLQMKKCDVNEERIRSPPSNTKTLFEGNMPSQGFAVSRVELRHYVERKDEQHGDYSLLTVLVETDRGSVEMKYDEGYRGSDALETAATFLLQYVGLASVINRALIELES